MLGNTADLQLSENIRQPNGDFNLTFPENKYGALPLQ
jgi:hypothetical protein